MRVWIDIDNPPQVRCMLPLARRFEEAGHDVMLTARAYGDTFAILESEGKAFEPVGSSFGKGTPRKLYGLAKRTRQLIALLKRQWTRPDLVVTGSRSATLAARWLGISSFVIIDYEYVNLFVYRLSGSHILHPDVIDGAVLERQGIPRKRLLPFDGLKEDIAFADVDLFAVAPHEFGDSDGSTPRVLFRPPAEESHYYRSEAREFAIRLLRFLAAEGARVVFSPRYSRQVAYLDEVPRWRKEPIVLREPVPFVALLKGVDAVVSAGGTMLREAAYLGVPAYSIFRGNTGGVDRYLTSIDRLSLLEAPEDFSRIELERRRTISPLRNKPRAADEVIRMIIARAAPIERPGQDGRFEATRRSRASRG
jgi:predicted glycosyltransferase